MPPSLFHSPLPCFACVVYHHRGGPTSVPSFYKILRASFLKGREYIKEGEVSTHVQYVMVHKMCFELHISHVDLTHWKLLVAS